jgi:hypothetical protein
MSDDGSVASFLGLLSFMSGGRATVEVGGRPFISINSDERTLEVETDGAREAGLRLSRIVRLQKGTVGTLEGTERVAGELSRLGWKLTLLAEGEKVVTMGSGVSRLTGRISLNPLRVKKLLEALK